MADGDFVEPLPDLTDSLAESGLPDGQTLQQLDAETGQIVNECAAVLASIEDTIHADISDCVNTCHGDTGLCQACVLGDIADYVNRAGTAALACGDKIATQVNAAVTDAWSAAFAVGVPPPTQLQMQQALAGQAIDFADGGGTVGVGDGGSSDILPPDDGGGGGGGLGPPPSPIACPTGINPAALSYLTVLPGGGYCIPYAWDVSAVQNWCVVAFGGQPDAHIALLPTSSTPGIWVSGGCQFAIPQVCPQEISPPTPPPVPGGGNGTPPTNGDGGGTQPPITPGGGGSSLPGAGGGDTTVGGGGDDTTTPPFNGGGITLPPGDDCRTRLKNADPTLCYTADDIKAIIGDCQGWTYSVNPVGGIPEWTVSGPNAISSAFNEDFYVLHYCPPDQTQPPTPPQTPTQPPIPTGPKLPSYCDPLNAASVLFDVAGLAAFINDNTPSIRNAVLNATGNASGAATGITDFFKNPAGTIIASAVTALSNVISSVISIGNSASLFGNSCDSTEFTAISTQSGLLNLFGGWFGFIPDNLRQANQYTVNLQCQYLLPSADAANVHYSRGYITYDQWNLLVQANGFCPEWQKIDVEARKTRIGVQDAYRLWRLGLLTDQDFIQSWKRQGIDTDTEISRWVDAVQQYPGMADLIRMMVRDVADPKVVDFLQLDGIGDEAFENKWTGTLKRWGQAQGVQDEVARYFWRAHWQNPSPGQVYDWLHRLRPDDRSGDDPNANLVFTKDDAKKALAIADYVPGLLDNYIATSYRPYTRVDVRRMWETGVFTDIAQVRRAYRDLGYDAEHAENLAKFTVVNSARSRAKLLGELSVAEIQTAYRNDLITQAEAREYLSRAGLAGDQIPTTLDSIENRKVFDSRKIALASLQKRYFRGEFTDAQARDALVSAYMDDADANRTVSNWSFQRNAREKSITVAMLCKWYGKGMITLDQMLVRVRNLNYNEADALRIVESCNSDVQTRRQVEIEKALAKLQKQQQAAARDQQRRIREEKQALRELKLQHVHIHTDKRVRKNGVLTTTVTEKDVQKPDINITNTSEDVDINTPPNT